MASVYQRSMDRRSLFFLSLFLSFSLLSPSFHFLLSLFFLSFPFPLLSLPDFSFLFRLLVPGAVFPSGVASIGERGASAPLTAKNLPKIGENQKKIWKKEEKSGRKGKNREDSFTLPLLTVRGLAATLLVSPSPLWLPPPPPPPAPRYRPFRGSDSGWVYAGLWVYDSSLPYRRRDPE